MEALSRYRILACLGLLALLVGCANHQSAGDRLVRELAQTYPDQIASIAFENNPPLDPPTLFIDVKSSMSPDQQLRFLCDSVLPRIRSLDPQIAATVSYGWWTDDCSQGAAAT